MDAIDFQAHLPRKIFVLNENTVTEYQLDLSPSEGTSTRSRNGTNPADTQDRVCAGAPVQSTGARFLHGNSTPVAALDG